MLFRGKWDVVRAIAVFVVCGVVVFSPWLIRNYVWARNPVFPEGMSVLGRGHFSAEQVARWEAALTLAVAPWVPVAAEGQPRLTGNFRPASRPAGSHPAGFLSSYLDMPNTRLKIVSTCLK